MFDEPALEEIQGRCSKGYNVDMNPEVIYLFIYRLLVFNSFTPLLIHMIFSSHDMIPNLIFYLFLVAS
jgi:hypothetical protein